MQQKEAKGGNDVEAHDEWPYSVSIWQHLALSSSYQAGPSPQELVSRTSCHSQPVANSWWPDTQAQTHNKGSIRG